MLDKYSFLSVALTYLISSLLAYPIKIPWSTTISSYSHTLSTTLSFFIPLTYLGKLQTCFNCTFSVLNFDPCCSMWVERNPQSCCWVSLQLLDVWWALNCCLVINLYFLGPFTLSLLSMTHSCLHFHLQTPNLNTLSPRFTVSWRPCFVHISK